MRGLATSATATGEEQHILLHCPQLNDLRHTHIYLSQQDRL